MLMHLVQNIKTQFSVGILLRSLPLYSNSYSSNNYNLIGDCFGRSQNLVWNVSAWKHVLGIGTQVRSEDWIFLRNINILDTLSMILDPCYIVGSLVFDLFDPCYVVDSLLSIYINFCNVKKILALLIFLI